MSENVIILFGGGSPLIVEYEEICQDQNIEIQAIVNNIPQAASYSISNARQISPQQIDINYASLYMCPLFTPGNRYKATQEAEAIGLKPFSLLSAKSNLLPSTLVQGEGVFINKGVILGAVANLGRHVLINRGATLGHHLTLEDYVSIGPGVVIGGNVNIGKGSLIGAGSTILPSITIGKHAIVGAGSVVVKDIEDFAVVVGNPAKKIKESKSRF